MRRKIFASLLISLTLLTLLSIHKKERVSVYDVKHESARRSYLPWTYPIPNLNYREAFLYDGEMDDKMLEHMVSVDSMEESEEAKKRNYEMLKYYKRLESSTEREKRMPDIIHAGVKKCGTGWTKHILSWHPMIKTVPEFANTEDFTNTERKYIDHLPEVSKSQLLMQADMNCLRQKVGNAHSIYNLIPNAKVWITVCEPSGRTFSDFVHMMFGKNFQIMNVTDVRTQLLNLTETFDKFVDVYLPRAERLYSSFCSGGDLEGSQEKVPEMRIFIHSLYHNRIQSYLKEYARERFYVINAERMFKNPGREIEKLQDFLGIPKFLIADDFVKNPETGLYCLRPTVYYDSKLYKIPTQCVKGGHKGRTRSLNTSKKASEGAVRRLKSFYRCFDEKLFHLLGERFW